MRLFIYNFIKFINLLSFTYMRVEVCYFGDSIKYSSSQGIFKISSILHTGIHIFSNSALNY